MKMVSSWFVIFVIVGACTCGGRTECGGRAQISLLTGVHDDGPCRRVSTQGVLLYEAAKLLVDTHNNRTNGFKLEMAVIDTCGSITGALKAAMKALVWADINCLQPPHYLGIIGPDSATNAEAVQKVTSVLKVPHIVRKASGSPYLHYLAKEDNSYLVQGILKVIEELKWASFTLVAEAGEEGDDDVQNIAKKLTVGAIAKNLCVMVHDNDDDDGDHDDDSDDADRDDTSHIVHIGKPKDGFFSNRVNSTILVVSEGDLDKHISHVNSSNTIVLLEDARNDLMGLEAKVEKSRWWNGDQGIGKYDSEEIREVRWIQNAIEVYATALDTICKKKKCKGQVNPADWNDAVVKILETQNQKSLTEARTLDLSIKSNDDDLESLGHVTIEKNTATIHWGNEKLGEDDDKKGTDDDDAKNADDEDQDDSVPNAFTKIVSKGEDSQTGCATALKEAKMLHEEEGPTHVIVSEMDDSEWWTMVGTVSGVGVAMFVVGILAVYVVYSNIRGPRSPKGKSGKGRAVDRDTSLRRVGSDREMPASGGARNQRPHRGPQRRDSNRSIRSNMSDRSV